VYELRQMRRGLPGPGNALRAQVESEKFLTHPALAHRTRKRWAQAEKADKHPDNDG
jgi:hypothetical protein